MRNWEEGSPPTTWPCKGCARVRRPLEIAGLDVIPEVCDGPRGLRLGRNRAED